MIVTQPKLDNAVPLWYNSRDNLNKEVQMNRHKTTSSYSFTNTHPNGIVSNTDCVIRAISIATGKGWLEVYTDLVEMGYEVLALPNDKKVYTPYLDKIATRVPVMKNRKRLTGKDVAKLDKTKSYVVVQANHLVAVKDGKVRDTWDSSHRSSYLIWELR